MMTEQQNAPPPPCEAALQFERVGLDFDRIQGDTLRVFSDLNLEVRAGEFVSIVGPSGCGKTSILKLAAGLLRPTRGEVKVFGMRLTETNTKASYVSQADALLPWKTVGQNIILGLQIRGIPKGRRRDLLEHWLELMGLQGFADVYPHELSGGMRKRAALAQAWIVKPDIILMDEPFSMLDVITRYRVEEELLALWAHADKQSVLFITHDLEEAISLSDEVIVLGAQPATHIVGRFRVQLPRPRPLWELKMDSGFIEIYRAIATHIHREAENHAPISPA